MAALFIAGWLVYSRLPQQTSSKSQPAAAETTLLIVLRSPVDSGNGGLDIPVELYPIDIVAAHHEYFSERRAGKSLDDFLTERMKPRTPVSTRLDKQGQASVAVSQGSWWLHAQLPGDENLEWRLHLDVVGRKQIVELNSGNVYTRTKSF